MANEMASIGEQRAPEYQRGRVLVPGFTDDAAIAAQEREQEGTHEAGESIVGNEQTRLILVDELASLPEQPERAAGLQVLRHFLGNAEETEHLIDYIQELWETVDLLILRLGNQGARKIVQAPGVTFSDALGC